MFQKLKHFKMLMNIFSYSLRKLSATIHELFEFSLFDFNRPQSMQRLRIFSCSSHVGNGATGGKTEENQ